MNRREKTILTSSLIIGGSLIVGSCATEVGAEGISSKEETDVAKTVEVFKSKEVQPTIEEVATQVLMPTATLEPTVTPEPTVISEIREELPGEGVVADVKREVDFKGVSEMTEVECKAVRYGHVVLCTSDEMIDREGGMADLANDDFPPENDFDDDPLTQSAEAMVNEATDRMFSHAYAEQNKIYHENYWEAEEYYQNVFKPLLEEARANRESLMVVMSDGVLKVDATKDVEIILVKGEGPIVLIYENLGFDYQRREDDLGMRIFVYSNQSYDGHPYGFAYDTMTAIMYGGSRNLRMMGGTFISSGDFRYPDLNPNLDIFYLFTGDEGGVKVSAPRSKPLALITNSNFVD